MVPRFLVPISFVQPPVNDHFGRERIGTGILRLHQGEELLGAFADASAGYMGDDELERMTKLK